MLKIKVFDESHEKDLEKSINNFIEGLDNKKEIIDIKFNVAVSNNDTEEIYCFSALIMYDDIKYALHKPKKYEIFEKVSD